LAGHNPLDKNFTVAGEEVLYLLYEQLKNRGHARLRCIAGAKAHHFLILYGPTKEAAEKHQTSPEGTTEFSPGCNPGYD
jgi:hypothetical protein